MKFKRLYSVKYRIIGILFALLIPLAVGLLLYSLTIMEKTRMVVYETGKSGFGMYMEILEKEVEGIDIHLNDIILKNEEIKELNKVQDKGRTYLLAYTIKQRFSAPLKAMPEMLAMMVYSESNDYLLSEYNDGYELSEVYTLRLRNQVEMALMKLCRENGAVPETWFHMEMSDRQLYCRIKKYGSVSCIGVLDMDLVATHIEADYSSGGKVLFLDNSGQPYMGTKFIDSNGLELPGDAVSYVISGNSQKYMGIMDETEHFKAVYLMPYTVSGYMLAPNEKIILFCTVFLMAAVPIVLVYLKKYILSPLKSLRNTMEHIAGGTLEPDQDIHYDAEEFEQVNVTFKNMLKEIRLLKIESYEREIQRQKIEFQYLQLQIRPHFLFNCMKNMYGMAQNRKIDEIKQSILLLSNHLRYIFTSDSDMVLLSQELWQCQNYMELLKYSQQIHCSLDMDVEAGLEDFLIPPISVLTFVENSAKYATNEKKELALSIRVSSLELEDCGFIQIVIQDGGAGFFTETLKILNSGQEVVDESGRKHVGIYNVIHRCIFNYGKDFYISFTNSQGARVVLLLPVGNDGGVYL